MATVRSLPIAALPLRRESAAHIAKRFRSAEAVLDFSPFELVRLCDILPHEAEMIVASAANAVVPTGASALALLEGSDPHHQVPAERVAPAAGVAPRPTSSLLLRLLLPPVGAPTATPAAAAAEASGPGFLTLTPARTGTLELLGGPATGKTLLCHALAAQTLLRGLRRPRAGHLHSPHYGGDGATYAEQCDDGVVFVQSPSASFNPDLLVDLVGACSTRGDLRVGGDSVDGSGDVDGGGDVDGTGGVGGG